MKKAMLNKPIKEYFPNQKSAAAPKGEAKPAPAKGGTKNGKKC